MATSGPAPCSYPQVAQRLEKDDHGLGEFEELRRGSEHLLETGVHIMMESRDNWSGCCPNRGQEGSAQEHVNPSRRQ